MRKQLPHRAVTPPGRGTWSRAGFVEGRPPNQPYQDPEHAKNLSLPPFSWEKKKRDIHGTLYVTPFWTKISRDGESQVVLTLLNRLPHFYKEAETERAVVKQRRGVSVRRSPVPSSLSLEQFGAGSPRRVGLTKPCTSAARPLGVLLQSGQPRRSVPAPEPDHRGSGPSRWPANTVHSHISPQSHS